MLKTVYALWP